MSKRRKGVYHAHYKSCNADISIEHGGRDDIKRHLASQKHIDLEAASSSTSTITHFFAKLGSSEEDQVTKAELYFTSFIIEHNIPISASDHAGSLFRNRFPDSKIVKKYQCARTKTSHIILLTRSVYIAQLLKYITT